jgi:chromosome partitioning protein
VLLDCAPALNLLNQNALIYAQEAVIPISMEYLAIIGVLQMIENIKMINQLMNHHLEIGLVIPTFYDTRNRKSHEVLESLNKHFPGKITNPVRINVRLSESPSYYQTIYEYAPNCYLDYKKIARRIINGNQTSITT